MNVATNIGLIAAVKAQQRLKVPRSITSTEKLMLGERFLRYCQLFEI